MTKIIHKTGNIFTTTAQGIGHGVNVDGVMGSGIAVQFRKAFPQMHLAYKSICRVGNLVPGAAMIWSLQGAPEDTHETYYVYNIASQARPGPNATLEFLARGVKSALVHAEKNNVAVLALPRIGSGVGGLRQDDVEEILTRLAQESSVDIEIWTYDADQKNPSDLALKKEM